MYYLYTNAFTLYRYGYANAVGVVLAIIIALFSVLQFKNDEHRRGIFKEGKRNGKK